MTDTPNRQTRYYPSFADPPPRAISTDALLGAVIRRVFEDAARCEDGLAGTLRAVLAALDRRIATASKPSR
ncbi:hypothetical protein ASF60_05175 [Methylobacterium sp. Leaf113]|uniref:hypothetical protein n=1 Tax=Methylobacterium sp. Leaf113 TaxID=1736259 RepID=UPI0006F95A7A|nr:hypothetical protein [Methylobacterium sp. Leaf113]KQP85492.1 hypothetical protein ASF60_05175 [Methylobacterium sp. Leaf113]